ncbi:MULTISPECIES: GHKL domain-containing protein [unclassified Lysinibacillus]|uniref:sensor histidine kinase n=1 Tax=unclassified Lysinibacillus TaxID=2636778 RepID=UPI0020111539|nr:MULTISPECIES: GHKL domain-containing protein [unclassified Lysinibacillus]MCL1694404.1 GHKL domain-containing protein [Lysinibacillus sp. BPa_S21]MCL1699236.1 GHKL domain-containing protein [Lysinibacillus sp. Bpr_S20]
MSQISTILYFTLFLIIHVQAQITFFQLSIPIYLIALVVLIIVFLLRDRLASPQLFFCMIQGIVCSIYFLVAPSAIYLVAIVLFLLLEWYRRKESRNNKSLQVTLHQIQTQQSQVNETFRVVRQERHDFLKHVAALHFLMEKNDYLAAKDYLHQLVEGYEETNLSIKGERGVIAGILHDKYKHAKASNITILYDLDTPCSQLPIADTHLVALLGNILTNSIEACQEWQVLNQDKGTISLQLYKRSGLYILICKNSTIPLPTNIVDSLFDRSGLTTKQEHEGLGTTIIKDIVQKYNGFLDFTYKDEEFTLKLKFPAVH